MTATYALIPAAGRGARFNTSGETKVFVPLRGLPLLRRTVAALAAHPQIDGILVVTGSADVGRCRDILVGLDKVMAVVVGGKTRQESVQIGLFALGAAPGDLILVHDGARPLVTAAIIDRCLHGARVHGNAVAAWPVSDTLKRVDAGQIITETIDRQDLWAVQTPQAFHSLALINAHVAAAESGFVGTDEASLIERFGDGPVHLVLGAAENLKITRADDLALAEALLVSQQGNSVAQTRVGFGYDIHRLVVGRRLVLGGVQIADPQGRGLEGHSDADVLLHAICDALLGGAGLPDIGTLYPNTDPEYAGIDSLRLLQDVADRVHRAGFAVVNVDATLIAESPKIAPYVDRMRQNVAPVLGLESSQVGIKATTNEGLGSLGRGEGIAAHAVVSLTTL